MSTREVSVIIPTYNRARLVARAIESVLAQTYARCHVIVVDDGSRDDTAEVIAARWGGEPRVRYLRQDNAGVSAARNTALAHADADYVAFLDSDDVWRPWKLELQVACLEALAKQGVAVVWTDKDIVDDAGAVVRRAANRSAYGIYKMFAVDDMFGSSAPVRELAPAAAAVAGDARVLWGDVYSYIALGNLCAPSTVMLTRARAAEIGPFDVTMKSGEDHAYHLRACSFGPAAFIDVPTVAYRKGAEDQLTAAGYELTIARNALRTVMMALDDDRRRVTLPPAVIDAKLAFLHRWIGGKLLESHDNAAARAHLAASLRHQPAQPRVWGMLAAASMPPRVTEALRQSYRAARNVARRRAR